MRNFITFLAKGGIYSGKTPCFKQKKSHYLDKKICEISPDRIQGYRFLKNKIGRWWQIRGVSSRIEAKKIGHEGR
ncbi:hypothetical protein VSAK1_05265 [Vibrio mediterranei AK1]|uniref:hypothetical protein n=1 Tax=Vibrio mediterranei TaxID=689 RepID=UPI0001542A93|nr:hypothetical protein [Vibrio mediterranei]EDL51796.1 hypothetical protein VSAK1_05265 [Vibrio mediterranei AK1]